MTDIAFKQIKSGQRVRLHLSQGFEITATAEADAYSEGGGDWRLKCVGGIALCGYAVERVELLSEPAPRWKVGQVGLVNYEVAGVVDVPATWDGEAWLAITGGQRYHESVGRPARLVPADAVVLPARDPNGNLWASTLLRDYAKSLEAPGRFAPFAAAVFHAIADAVEGRDSQ